MSLRLIARDLYRLQREVDRMERLLAEAKQADKPALQRQLVRARHTRDAMRRMLDGHLDR